ncbi:nucleolin [Anopheles aquasalis]|uniref:nucleolin n=1 Tax=Anopheles aquasalis TaxID=42839 RepID=UPI00215A3D37|nr:nucleolin [Anopheles aquasalis]
MASNPSKEELREEIRVILKDANLEETAVKKVRMQLEKNLSCDLSARKKEVDDLVMEYVNSQGSSGEEEEDDEDDKKGSGKKGSKSNKSSDYEEEDEEDEDDEDDDDDDYSEDEKPKGRKSGGKRGTPAKRGPAPKKKKRQNSDSEDNSGSDDDEEEEEEGSDEDYRPQKGAKGAKGGNKGKKRKDDSESDSDEDWKQAKKPKAKGKAAAGGAKKGGARGTGYTRPYTLSADLAALCGAESLPRHEVVKKIWTIIKERNLYDPKNKQFAICDAELHKVIGVKRFRTFGMLKYLKPHFKD